MRSQVTTKQGDGGETRTLGGEKVPKSHPIVECTGALDEARAYTALVRHHLLERFPEGQEGPAQFLLWLLHVYFLIGTACNDPRRKHPEYRRGELGEPQIRRLEAEQERLESRVTLPRQFIVTASNPLSAEVDVLATHVRRLERSIVRLKESVPEFDTTALFPFINRLSDTLYLLARDLEHGTHHTVDYSLLEPKD
ncbi:MAG: ATP:cob(I)alamin adenosyltransferase [Candidatus Hydrogenedentes bacterium]|nr:ATP:cob(I)alamin adenosyltransferase [Candidatus Hydrogenedentota bacterium]